MDANLREPEAEIRIRRILGEDSLARVYAPIEQASGLPNAAYWSPDWYQLEQERLFRRCWVFAGAEAEVAQPGDVKPLEAGGVPVLLARGRDGTIRAFQNVCRHRGIQLVEAPCNRTVLTCPYHAWSYGLDGKLRSRPHFHGADKGDSFNDGGGDKLDLLEVRCDSYHGCVFVDLSGTAAPLHDWLAPLTDALSGYDLSALRWAGRLDFEIDANWKLIYENFIEEYHVFALHPRLHDFVPMGLRNVGGWHDNTFANGYRFPAVEPGRGEGMPHYPGLSEENRARGQWFLTLPHFALEVFPDQLAVLAATPLAPDRTREELHIFLIGDEAAHGDRFAAGRKAIFSTWDDLNKEDLGILPRLQQGRRCPGYDGGRLSAHWEQPTLDFCRKIVDLMMAS